MTTKPIPPPALQARTTAPSDTADQPSGTDEFSIEAADSGLNLARLAHELQVHRIELELQNEEVLASRAQVEDALARYMELYDCSPVAYFTWDRLGTIQQVNLTGARLLGIDRAQLINYRFNAYLAPADLAAFDTRLEALFSNASPIDAEFQLAGPRDPPRILHVDAALSPDRLTCHAVVTDVTARKMAEARLRLAASVFTHAREGITIISPLGKIIDVNAAFTDITGYMRTEVLGQSPSILNAGQQGPEFYAAIDHALMETGHWTGEIRNRRKNGQEYIEATTITTVKDADGRVLNRVALSTDVTMMKAQQERLEHIAHYDSLTNLPNRVLLADRLQQAMNQCQRHNRSLVVAYLDLDGFKTVNDQHGHNAGDDLLVVLAQRMKAALREGDTLARIGGDEFIAVLADLEHTQDCAPVLSRLLQAASAPVILGKTALQVSASIGVTVYPQDAAEPEQLMRHADQAMYQAKQAGRNRYHLFDVHQDVAMRSRNAGIEEIIGALSRDEFVLHYQPKISMKSGEVTGVEALIRWQHPELGLLLPARFLPIIESHTIGIALGEWVLKTALNQMDAWRANNSDIPISVNIGAHQLQQDVFVPTLTRLLSEHPDIQHHFLELEVLESSALENMIKVSAAMDACHRLGVRFAIDDFGTGYSSLTYLRHLPADRLKIDQSFVSGMLGNCDDRAIVEGVIGLVHAFHRDVIAEGVESPAHGALLQTLGCEFAQGYGISHPLPAEEIPGWIAQWRKNWPLGKTSWAPGNSD